MSKIKVTALDQYTLRLEEDGKKGDLIDLNEIVNVDTKPILDAIEKSKDSVYLKRLKEHEEKLKVEFDLEVNRARKELSDENIRLKEQLKSIEEKIAKELELKYNNEINELRSKFNQENIVLKEKLDSLKNEVTSDLTIKYNNQINELKAEIERTKLSKDLEYTTKLNLKENDLISLKNKLELETQKLNNLKEKEIIEVKSEYEESIRKLNEEIAQLKRERSTLNVKRIGEDLEIWCDNEFNSQNLVGLPNVTWQKDNEVIKGSKADFIYKVYASEEKLENELLTSVVLEMKSEDPNSVNKQSLEPILKKLDNDRNNKNIEYAVLVSELGISASNSLPIKKVNEYEKMYIVRPEYFMMLLNIITAFGMKYKELIIAKETERIKFKDFEDILADFETMKSDILDRSIKHINTQLNEIITQSDNIKKSNEKILKAAELIKDTHLKTVINKINDFKINKITNRIKEIN